jgi:single-stranded-DNA-specific exonuclease
MTNPPRTLTYEAIFTLLSKRFDNTFLSLKDLPHPSTFKDMDRAVARIVQAIQNHEKIILIGDYDVDGVVSTSIMQRFFDAIDYPLAWIIPNRFTDGYGLSTTLIPRVAEYDLVITVDNGISAVEAANECDRLGIDLIITDHHIVPETIPKAYAIINQKQSECNFPHAEICGAQIAWYLCSALNKTLQTKRDMKVYLELVAMAIIADVMPLQHINRAMVQAGIKLLNQSQRPALRAYREQRNKQELSSEDIAFGLAPILNSAGRLEDASLAVAFLCSTNIYDARTQLESLMALNDARKALEQEITDAATTEVDEGDKVIVVASENWHEGVVGIVAARLARLFERPAIVLTKNGDVYKGSGRSFNGCDLFGLVDTQRQMLQKFGGHSAAIGLAINKNNLDAFRRALNIKATTLCNQKPFIDPDILGELPFSQIGFPLIEMIAQFEPFGEANPKPKFLTRDVEILAVQTMGKESNHLRFTFGNQGTIHNAVQFKTYEQYDIGQKVDVVYTINKNYFRGDTTIQLMVEQVIRMRQQYA